jgi:NhaP-type Na+/H+ or K+/H+ antiporter
MQSLIPIASGGSPMFERTLLLLGVLLMAGALLSSLVKRGFLSLVAIYVLVGIGVGRSGLGWIELSPSSQFVGDLTIAALIVILFRDGVEADGALLRTDWHLPARKIILAMPITIVIISLVAHYVVGLSWLMSGLLGALLSPTDPVLSSTVVTNPRIPIVVRQSLNLESGLNDGLALPVVLAFVAALTPTGGFSLGEFLLRDIGGGLVAGLIVAFAAARLLPKAGSHSIPAPKLSLYALGTAFVAYGLAVIPIHGNGLIAVFVCAIVVGIMREDLIEAFVARADDVVEIVKLLVFLVFGATLSLSAIFSGGWGAVAIVVTTFLIARPAGVFLSLLGSGVDNATKAFMAWFGPKGVATMSFSLLVLARVSDAGQVVDLAALCVLFSIFAHGLTDVPGSNWMASRRTRESV